MGYTTQFDGTLRFTHELSVPQLAKLQTFFGEDPSDHPEWLKEPGDQYSYLQYELTKDFTGLEWDGGEKFYNAVEALNLILLNMRAEWPGFGLEGELHAQGEDMRDRWVLAIENGRAVRRDVKIEGSIYECPGCGEHVITSEAKKIQ
jgi:hypothetical protein